MHHSRNFFGRIITMQTKRKRPSGTVGERMALHQIHFPAIVAIALLFHFGNDGGLYG
jgi:hypothetical protein